jgi:TatD DNase family protein
VLTDAHLHLVDLAAREPAFPEAAAGLAWSGCAASHSEAEYEASEALRARLAALGLATVASFGIHPQAVSRGEPGFLARLVAEGRLAAIGEAGFDFFGDRPELVRDDANERAQRAAFELQLDLAERAGLPLLIHIRKAMDLAFEYAPRLKRLPAAIFHSYSGAAEEGEALLRRGVQAFFSFGAVVLNGHKRAIRACAALPAERLLSETDAPWQPPRGSPYSALLDLRRVALGMGALRGLEAAALEEVLAANFRRAYGGS